MLVLDDGDSSIVVVSYELNVDELGGWVADLVAVSENEWLDAGGIVQ